MVDAASDPRIDAATHPHAVANGDAAVTEDQLAAVCSGKPAPLTAPYAGKVHPLVVVVAKPALGPTKLGEPDRYAINKKWVDDTWPSLLQLVACVRWETPKKTSYCGKYEGDGTTIRLWVGKASATIRVVVASTGKLLQKKVLTNPAPHCPFFYTTRYLSDDVLTNWVTDAQINRYATTVSKQPVK